MVLMFYALDRLHLKVLFHWKVTTYQSDRGCIYRKNFAVNYCAHYCNIPVNSGFRMLRMNQIRCKIIVFSLTMWNASFIGQYMYVRIHKLSV